MREGGRRLRRPRADLQGHVIVTLNILFHIIVTLSILYHMTVTLNIFTICGMCVFMYVYLCICI